MVSTTKGESLTRVPSNFSAHFSKVTVAMKVIGSTQPCSLNRSFHTSITLLAEIFAFAGTLRVMMVDTAERGHG